MDGREGGLLLLPQLPNLHTKQLDLLCQVGGLGHVALAQLLLQPLLCPPGLLDEAEPYLGLLLFGGEEPDVRGGEARHHALGNSIITRSNLDEIGGVVANQKPIFVPEQVQLGGPAAPSPPPLPRRRH